MTDDDRDAPAPGQVPLIEAFWLEFQRACAIKVEGFSASALGPTRAVADVHADLVRRGVKRAHATLKRDFDAEAEPLPQPGEHLVVLDGDGRPQAIVRLSHVELRRFNEIDDTFAFEAGEGDASLRWWLVAYRQEFGERGEREGFEVGERTELLLEYFESVWPPAAPAG
jgi:uncharacterized protein YhfF